eukprot:8166254-Alexandrium_andersonii.AAC.1
MGAKRNLLTKTIGVTPPRSRCTRIPENGWVSRNSKRRRLDRRTGRGIPDPLAGPGARARRTGPAFGALNATNCRRCWRRTPCKRRGSERGILRGGRWRKRVRARADEQRERQQQ